MSPKYSKTSSSRRWSSRSRGQWLAFLLILAAIIATIWYFNRQSGQPVVDTNPTSTAITSAGEQIASLPATLSVEQAYARYNAGAFFLDVREQSEWDAFHIPGATLIPLGQLEARLAELPRDREIVVVCRSGNRSQSGRDTLLAAGFPSVTSMSGGVTTWSNAGYPIEGTRP
jgi:rhodanese-related sulfurtransferase